MASIPFDERRDNSWSVTRPSRFKEVALARPPATLVAPPSA